MSCFDYKDLLMAVLDGEYVDKPPVILPSGLVSRPMNSVVDGLGLRDDSLHGDSSKLSRLAVAIQEKTKTESLALPFILTVESEAYGGEREESVTATEPEVFTYPLKKVAEIASLKELNSTESGRLPVVINTLKELKVKSEELSLPLIGDLVGPLSLASTLVDVSTILKSMAKGDDGLDEALGFLAEGSERFASSIIDSGADCIFITDPMSTADIVGPKYFEKYSSVYLNRLTEYCHSRNVPVIVHLCGNLSKLPIDLLSADCISLDGTNSPEFISTISDDFIIMAGPSEDDFRTENVQEIRTKVKDLIDCGVRVLSTSCSLGGDILPESLGSLVDASYDLLEEPQS